MQNSNQQGFSLVELLVVVTIVGIVSTLSIAFYKKAINASENGAIFAAAKVMVKEQTNEFTKRGRYARLDELNEGFRNNFGASVGNTIERGKFTFSMSPVNPTDGELKENFTIIATRVLDSQELPYVISVDASGEVIQITP
jgi:prepilin-type N-terminal cleavage/methylation domain-containing protein